jgi:Protein of unknown function (DUF2637)
MWSRLPTNLRTILGCALALGIGVTAAAFTLSFFALRAAATNPELQFGRGHEWLFPIALDMGLVFAEVLLLGASMVKDYNRAIPIMLVLAFGIGTVYFNVTRVPPEVRLITAVPPLASIFMTIGLAYLMKMLTAISGSVQQYHLSDPVYGQLGAPPTTTVMRLPDGSYGLPGYTYPPQALAAPDTPPQAIVAPSFHENGQNGQTGSGNGQSKRRLVESYLDGLSSQDLKALTARQVAKDLTDLGHPVTERTVIPVLKARRARG